MNDLEPQCIVLSNIGYDGQRLRKMLKAGITYRFDATLVASQLHCSRNECVDGPCILSSLAR